MSRCEMAAAGNGIGGPDAPPSVGKWLILVDQRFLRLVFSQCHANDSWKPDG
jgi:hypothetical protein